MKKAVKTLVAVLCVGATSVGVVNGMSTAKADNNPFAFNSSIRAVTPYDGGAINFNTKEINAFWNCEGVDLTYLNTLYEYTTGHQEFLSCVNDTSAEGVARLVEIYKENDAFQPVNNVLKWSDNLSGVASYTVRIALDNKFTKTVQKVENADKSAGVVLENPFMDTEYYWQVIANMENGGKTYSPIFSFATDASVRTVEIEGVSNTRDLGGFETVYGYVQQGLVYRSARLETMTAAGKAAFESLGIKSDLDLRGTNEASNAPNTYDPMNLGEQYFVFDTPYYVSGSGTRTDNSTYLNNSNNFENVKNIVSVFADKDNYPIDMHCSVGRDRTGTMAIVLKSLLGASEENSKKDYYSSMFATTGAWAKGQTATQATVVDNIYAYLNTFEGETLADRTASYLIGCGVTQEQIDTIRNIWVGAEGYEVETVKTFADTDNYDGYAFVTFENFGVKTQVMAVAIGEKAVAPYALAEGESWTVGGKAYNLDAKITGDITLTAKKAEYCTVTIKSVTDGESYTVQVVKGNDFNFSTLVKDGYNVTVITENGNIVTSYTVEDDCVLNVLYTK